MATTDINVNFDTNHVNLTNMVINYDNEAVATSNNALLSIAPLAPATGDTYNIMTPTITYSPNPRAVLSNSTTSNILINEDDGNLILEENIQSLDFDVGGSITTLTVGETVDLVVTATSSSTIDLLDSNFSTTLSAIIKSLTTDTGVVFWYQLNSTIYIFIPNGSITSIYTSTILSNEIITTPELINVTIPAYVESAYVAMNGDYMYVIGLNSSSDIVIYYASISNGVLSSFTLSTVTLPAIVNNFGTINSTQPISYANLVANLFLVYNSYIYILGSITTSFEYAYAPINSNGSIGTWVTGASLFPTSTNTLLGFSQTTVYNGVIYVSGLLEIHSTLGLLDGEEDTFYYPESSNFYTITINANGSLNTAVSYNYPSGLYASDSSILLNNDNLYFFNLYSGNQSYGSFSGNNVTYYTNINSLGVWNSLTINLTNPYNLYYVASSNRVWAFTSSNNSVTSLTLNSNYILNNILKQPSLVAGYEIYSTPTAITGNNNIIYGSNTNYYVFSNNNLMNFTLNNEGMLVSSGANTFIDSSSAQVIAGFVYGNYLYLTYAIATTTTTLTTINNLTNNVIYQYLLNSYGNLTTQTALISMPTNLAKYNAVVLNGVVYIIGGILGYNQYYGGTNNEFTSGGVNTTIYSSVIGSNGTLGAWTTTTITVPSVGLFSTVANVNDQYLLAIGYDGHLYSSAITSNVPGDFTSIDSSLTLDNHMVSLLYINGMLFLGCYANSSSNLSLYYTSFDTATNTISGWQSISTLIPDTYYPSLFYNQNNNSLVFIDTLNEKIAVYYLDNQNFIYSLMPTTAFSAVPSNYYINNLNVIGLVGDSTINSFSNMTLASSTFNAGTYTLTYNPITNNMNGLNCYLNISNIYNGDIISELQFSIQGKTQTFPPIT